MKILRKEIVVSKPSGPKKETISVTTVYLKEGVYKKWDADKGESVSLPIYFISYSIGKFNIYKALKVDKKSVSKLSSDQINKKLIKYMKSHMNLTLLPSYFLYESPNAATAIKFFSSCLKRFK